MKEKVTDLMEMVEQEMLILWADEVSIPKLLKEDLEFVNVIIQGIMLEKHFWNKQMVVGEA
jgi:hypothetical protein|tara:strand:+ start:653 stop:835 length:183 start_codon:yes stop_codon:yes gene_type:complete